MVGEGLAVLRATTNSVHFETKFLKFKNGDEVVLGRTRPDKKISRETGLFPATARSTSGTHAVLRYVDSKFFLTDKSNNGTYVDGKRLSKNQATLLNATAMEVSLGIIEKDKIRVAAFILWALPAGDTDVNYAYKLDEGYRVESNFYDFPTSNISICLEEMNELVKSRLAVLLKANDFSFADIHDTAKRERFLKLCEEHYVDEFHLLTLFKHFRGRFKVKYDCLTNDRISHSLLLLSTCNNKGMKFWFIEQESKLWIVKWTYFNESQKLFALDRFGVKYEKVDDLSVLREKYDTIDAGEIHFRVPFYETSSIINDRTVVLIKGTALVPLSKMIFLVLMSFKHRVLDIMDNFRSHLKKLWADERMRAVFNFVKNKYHFRYEGSGDTKITLQDIPKLLPSFPLCMNELQHYLEMNNHLHNGGRFQYSLFLKKVGLTMRDSLVYFRQYFTKKMTPYKFHKRYAYHIRHIYGQEGRRVSYDPLNCRKILNKKIAPFRHDGCPFKVLSKPKLGVALARNGISDADSDALWNIAHDSDSDSDDGDFRPQTACAKYFQMVHSVPYGHRLVDHPNDYFKQSRQIYEGENQEARGDCGHCPVTDDALSW